jgi:hypothetical protein
MSKRLIGLSILGVVFAFVFAFGASAQAQQMEKKGSWFSSDNQMRVDRDFGEFYRHDANRFGDDRAYTSTSGGTDRDADFRLFNWVPDTYGLGGDYGYDSSGSGG